MLPDQIGRYKILARLGKGAMGTVYRAVDTQTGQEVALKVIAPELALDPEMLGRFQREGEALLQLHHPNIVGFVDMFEWEGQHVIAMEYVPGDSLYKLIKQGPLPLERARQIALDLSDALIRAHRLGIIHRDLKPENVLLAADGTPKLTDFGVARLIGEGTRLTGTGTQVGTPYYMAPEAWEGKPLDAQADIWALGVVLYEMLAGEVPFGGPTLVAVMNQVLNAPLPDLKPKRPEAPEGLVQIIQRMLTRDKAERYQTVREVAADLEKGRPTAALRPALTRKAAKPPQRVQPRGLLIIAGLVILALLGGGVFLAAQLQSAQTSARAAATALWQVGQAAALTASRPTDTLQPTDTPKPTETPAPSYTPAPTDTLDVLTLAAQMHQAETQQVVGQTATMAMAKQYAAQTRAVDETFIALTPSATPTITFTPSKTPLPLPTTTPRPTATPVLHTTYLDISASNGNPSSCDPIMPPGLFVFKFSSFLEVDRNRSLDEIKAAVGDTAAVFTVDGQPVAPLTVSSAAHRLDSRGREYPLFCNKGDFCGPYTYAQTKLDAGVYDVLAVWQRADGNVASKGCTITVAAP